MMAFYGADDGDDNLGVSVLKYHLCILLGERPEEQSLSTQQ